MTSPEVCDAGVGLFGPAQVALGDEHVAHTQHAQSPQLLGRVEDDGREAVGHLGVEADLDACLDLVLTLHQQVQQLLNTTHTQPYSICNPKYSKPSIIRHLWSTATNLRGHFAITPVSKLP